MQTTAPSFTREGGGSTTAITAVLPVHTDSETLRGLARMVGIRVAHFVRYG